MEPLIFDEKYLAGGSEPNRELLFKSGTISLGGREDLKSLTVSNRQYCDIRVDGEHSYHNSYVGDIDNPAPIFNVEFWRSGPSEISYIIMLGQNIMKIDWDKTDADHIDDSFNFFAEFESGDQLTFSLPFTVIKEPNFTYPSDDPLFNMVQLESKNTNVPRSVDWDFGGNENIYIPGNTSDTWRYQTGSNSGYDPSNICWGVTKNAAALLRVYEDALPPEHSQELIEINPYGYGTRNYKSMQSYHLYSGRYGVESVKVIYGDKEYTLPNGDLFDDDHIDDIVHRTGISIDIKGGQIFFDPVPYASFSKIKFEYELNNNVVHSNPTGIDHFNDQLTLQVTDGEGNVATKDILIQIVDDAPFVKGEATMDLSSVDAWTLGGNKLPLSYDYLKDVLYRSTDYNDWATGFKVTNCEGKYGSVGVFGDDGNPDDPASAPGSAYYMPDPDKLAFIAPGETVTEAVAYTYTDSDGDTANGVLNITLKGTGLNPDEAIKITPRPGNVPTSGVVPGDNPYVPGNPDDPDRDLTFPVAGDYDPMNPNWGLDIDGNALLRVFESGLPNGNEPGWRNVTAHGYLDIDATVGLKSIVATTDGLDSYGFEDNMMAIPLDGGTLTLTQNPDENYLKYEFTLTAPVMHEDGHGINSKEQPVKLIATDNYGNEETIGLEVQIIDDVPIGEASRIEEVVYPVYMWQDNFFNGSMPLAFLARGADSIHGYDSCSIETAEGKYGTVELYEDYYDLDGVLVYDIGALYTVDQEKTASLRSDEAVTDNFKYIYTDADGDRAESNIKIVLNGPGIKPHFVINEADLCNGCELSIDGYVTDYEKLGTDSFDFYVPPKYGTVSQDSDGAWRYRLSEAVDSGPIQGSNVVNLANEIYLPVWRLLYEGGGDVGLLIMTDVDIIDSVPTFTASQNRLAYDFGADNGPGAGLKVAVGGAETDLVPGVETMIAGQHGLLALSADGSCNYTPNSDAAGIDRFDFTIIDSDGDRALATIEASVQDGTPQMAMSVQDADSLAAIAALGVSPETGALAGA